MPCPHERAVRTPAGFACAACGAPIGSGPSDEDVVTEPRWTSRLGVEPRVLGGMALALLAALRVAWWLPFAAWIVGTLGTLAHEIGHAAMGWLLGRPSLPKFDLVHGGGVTLVGERWNVLLAAYGALVAIALWPRRANRLALAIGGGASLAVLLVALSDWWSELAVIAAGAWGQVLIAGIFLFRALSGVAVTHAAERWLYAAVGWLLVIQAGGMAARVAWDDLGRSRYLDGKGGMDNDWVIIGERLDVGLEGIAVAHLLLAIATPLLAWAAWRWRQAIAAAARATLATR